VPKKIGSDSWISVSAGDSHTLGIKADGTLWSWGYAVYGALGDGSSDNSIHPTPAQVGTASDWVAISAGAVHSLGVRADASLWEWGSVGGPPAYRPRQVGSGNDWTTISAATNFSLALKVDGSLWSWGQNTFYQLGDGTTTPRPTPGEIASDKQWMATAGGQRHGLALEQDGGLWGWGYNQQFGAVGDGTTTDRATPVPVMSLQVTQLLSSGAAFQGSGDSFSSAVSANGRFVVFESRASNLVAGDTNGCGDVFVHDRQTGVTERVSVASSEAEADAESGEPSISADGRYVAFQSTASNLVAGDTSGHADIFVRDRTSGTTTLVSVATGGGPGNGDSDAAMISANGGYVAFMSTASDLVASDGNGVSDVFRRDLVSGTTERVSVDTGNGDANASSLQASISSDGQRVAFYSNATDLVASPVHSGDVYVRDMGSGPTTMVSLAPGGVAANGGSGHPAISGDGNYVAFVSAATDLVGGGDANGTFNDVFVRNVSSGTTSRVSVSSGNVQSNTDCYSPSISAHGEFVIFQSRASNLVGDDGNGMDDVFLHIVATGATTRLSVASAVPDGDGNSYLSRNGRAMSADGSLVTFYGPASNLVAGDTNGAYDVFVRNVGAGTTERVSVTSGGPGGNGECEVTSTSADGRYVAFWSTASNFVPGDTNGYADIFVRDRVTGAVQRVSTASDGAQANRESTYYTAISADGRYVTFISYATNLVPGDTNLHQDVFRKDLQTGATILVSVDSSANQVNPTFEMGALSMTADGQYVAFSSDAPGLVPNDTNARYDVFVHDCLGGTTQRVSLTWGGGQSTGHSQSPSISPDGRYVAFNSTGSDIVQGDSNGQTDVFLRDLQTGQNELVSVASAGTQGDLESYAAAISADGRCVAFASNASNLVSGDSNGRSDVFVRDRESGLTERVSVSTTGVGGNNYSFPPSISADGRYVAYASRSNNLVPGDTNVASDVFVRDRLKGTTERASVADDGRQGANYSVEAFSTDPSISADGRCVAFCSAASNFAAGDANDLADVFVRMRW